MSVTSNSAAVRLDLLREEDEAQRRLYLRLYTCDEVMRNIAPPLSPEVADAAFQRTCRHNLCERPGHRVWAIVPAAGAAPVGIVAILRDCGTGEAGIMLERDGARRGVARPALDEAMVQGFGAMALDAVEFQAKRGAGERVGWRLVAPYGVHEVPAESLQHRRWRVERAVWTALRRV